MFSATYRVFLSKWNLLLTLKIGRFYFKNSYFWLVLKTWKIWQRLARITVGLVRESVGTGPSVLFLH